jgi:hypothetical protein
MAGCQPWDLPPSDEVGHLRPVRSGGRQRRPVKARRRTTGSCTGGQTNRQREIVAVDGDPIPRLELARASRSATWVNSLEVAPQAGLGTAGAERSEVPRFPMASLGCHVADPRENGSSGWTRTSNPPVNRRGTTARLRQSTPCDRVFSERCMFDFGAVTCPRDSASRFSTSVATALQRRGARLFGCALRSAGNPSNRGLHGRGGLLQYELSPSGEVLANAKDGGRELVARQASMFVPGLVTPVEHRSGPHPRRPPITTASVRPGQCRVTRGSRNLWRRNHLVYEVGEIAQPNNGCIPRPVATRDAWYFHCARHNQRGSDRRSCLNFSLFHLWLPQRGASPRHGLAYRGVV